MKIFRRISLFLFLLLVLSPTTQCHGIRDELTVHVINGPKEPYYLDILKEEDGRTSHIDNLDWNDLYPYDADLMQPLMDAVPNGWRACLSEGTNAPTEGQLTSPNGIHKFSYFGVPDTYRVVIATESGESWVSPVEHRNGYYVDVRVDWARKTLYQPSPWLLILTAAAITVPLMLLGAYGVFRRFEFSDRLHHRLFLWSKVPLCTVLAISVFLGVWSNQIVFLLLLLLAGGTLIYTLVEWRLCRKFVPGTPFSYCFGSNCVSFLILSLPISELAALTCKLIL